MYKKILVAVDDSHTALTAFQEAIKLATHQSDSCLYIFHVVDNNIIGYADITSDFSALFAARKAEGTKMLKKLAALAERAGVNYETISCELTAGKERVADKIISEAQRCGADLMVIGTHGRRGLDRLLLGSVAENVIRQATLPVLLVRDVK